MNYDNSGNPETHENQHPSNGAGSSNGPAGSAPVTRVDPSAASLISGRGSAQSPNTPSSTPDPWAILNALRRRWFLVLSLGLLGGAGAAAAAWFLVPAPYTATAELRISSTDPRFFFKTSEQQARFTTYKQTQMRMAQSPFVLSQAMNLSTEEIKAGLQARGVEPPESLPQVDNLTTLSLFRQQEKQDVRPLDWLGENISIGSPATEFLRFSLSGEQPRELAIIVNAVTLAYLDEVVNAERDDRQERLRKLQDIYRAEEEKLRTKRNSLKELAERLHTASSQALTERQKTEIELYRQLQSEYIRIRFELTRAKIQLQAMTKGATGVEEIDIPDSYIDANVSQHPEYQEAQNRVNQLERLISEYKSRVVPTSPRLKELNEKLIEAKNSLEIVRKKLKPLVIQELQAGLTAQQDASETELKEKIRLLELQKEELGKQLEEQRIQQQETGVQSVELELLRKDIAQSESIAQSIADEIERLEIELENQAPRIALLRGAEVPYIRDTGKKYKMTGLAGFGLFGVIAAGIVWIEFRSRRISALDEVSDGLSMRVMGMLPHLPRSATNGRSKRRNGRGHYWHSLLTESIDSARTMLVREAQRSGLKVVMITSAQGGEGKTTLSCHLSTSLARAGRSVLLLDGDLRWPSIHGVFDRAETPGLCEVLRGETSLEEAVQPTSVNGLSLLAAGQADHTVLQALAQDGLDPVFEDLKAKYDFVMVDTSPVLPVTDALLIAQHVDAVIFSIRRDVSRFGKVAAACRQLEMLGVPMLGTVVIGLGDGFAGFGYSAYDRRIYWNGVNTPAATG